MKTVWGLLIAVGIVLGGGEARADKTLLDNPANPEDPQNPLRSCVAPCVWSQGDGSFGLGEVIDVAITEGGQVVTVGYAYDRSIGGFARAYAAEDGTPLWSFTGQGTRRGAGGPKLTGVTSLPGGGSVAVGFDHPGGEAWQVGSDLFIPAVGWMVRFDADGQVLWQTRNGGAENRYFRDVVGFEDGRIAVLGYWDIGRFGPDRPDRGRVRPWVLLYDQDGTVLWEHVFEGSRHNFPHGLTQSGDDRLVVVGRVLNYGENRLTDAWAASLSIETGAVLWERNYGGRDSETAHNVIALPQDQVMAAGIYGGMAIGQEGKAQAWSLVLDADGEVVSEERVTRDDRLVLFTDLVASGPAAGLGVGRTEAMNFVVWETTGHGPGKSFALFGSPWRSETRGIAYDAKTDTAYVVGSTEVPEQGTGIAYSKGWVVGLRRQSQDP
ncbi:MAG: hypothetical protein ACPGOY_02305 [Rhodospirillaceae bacterium]